MRTTRLPVYSLFLILIMLFSFSNLTWSPPVRLLEFPGKNATVESVYRDPASALSHVVISCGHGYHYLAVTDSGEIVHRADFTETFAAYRAVIRGAGDGRGLFLAFNHVVRISSVRTAVTVNFTESSDGGKTWTSPISILRETPSQRKNLEDMLYLPLAGRVFVFFTEYPAFDLRMVTRPAGGIVFSPESVVVKDGVCYGSYRVKANFNLYQSKPIIHLVYKNCSVGNYPMMYTRSSTNGATWTIPRVIEGTDYATHVTNFVSSPTLLLSGGIYIAFTVGRNTPSRLAYSADFGINFSSPVRMSQKNSEPWATHGVAACGGHVVSMCPTVDGNAEYALWNVSEMTPRPQTHPYQGVGRITGAGLDCRTERGRRNVSSFVTVGSRAGGALYFAANAEDAI